VEIQPGREGSVVHVVDADDTALALGSGDVDVLATPRVIAWLEAATVAALADVLPDGSTSVGTRIDIDHRAASPVGAQVTASASLSHVDGRLVRFEVAAEHRVDGGDPVLIATGQVTRVVVDRERFLARV
jgi:predicted thioesterase